MSARLLPLLSVVLLLMTACGGEEPDVQATIDAAVSATATAQPTPTPNIQATVNAAVEATATAQAPASSPTPSSQSVRYGEAVLRSLLTMQEVDASFPSLEFTGEGFIDFKEVLGEQDHEGLVSFTGIQFQAESGEGLVFQIRDFISPNDAAVSIENPGTAERYDEMAPPIGERSFRTHEGATWGIVSLIDGAIIAVATIDIPLETDADYEVLADLARLVESRL